MKHCRSTRSTAPMRHSRKTSKGPSRPANSRISSCSRMICILWIRARSKTSKSFGPLSAARRCTRRDSDGTGPLARRRSAHYLDKCGSVTRKGFFEGRFEFILPCYSQSNRSERLGEPHEIRIDEIHGLASSMELRILQSRYARQATIVDYDGDDIDAVLNRGSQFLARHQETAITTDRDHLPVWKRELGAKCRRKGVPHRNER